MRISDWSSDVCSSDLQKGGDLRRRATGDHLVEPAVASFVKPFPVGDQHRRAKVDLAADAARAVFPPCEDRPPGRPAHLQRAGDPGAVRRFQPCRDCRRSEEHTSELQSLMRTSYAVFCLKKK